MKIEFSTRPSWKGHDGVQMGDLVVDGEDQGWASIDDARSIASANGTTVDYREEMDAVSSHPRRF